MKVLADSSVWIQHFRRGTPGLRELVAAKRVVMHPYVVGELACGALTPREETLDRLHHLRSARVAMRDEVHALIERVPLWGRGIGWVDAHLIASALLDRIRLWTLDRRLAEVAREVGVGWKESRPLSARHAMTRAGPR